MQFSRILTYPKSRATTAILIRITVYGVIVLALFGLLDRQTEYLVEMELPSLALNAKSWFYLIFAVILMPINWSFEALKWQLLCKTERISFSFAMQSVISGLTLGSVIPFGLGAAAGRVMSLKSSEREKNVPTIFVGQWTQTLITLLFGLVGIMTVLNKGGILNQNIKILFFLPLMGAICLIVYFRYFPDHKDFVYNSLSKLTLSDMVKLFSLSLLRYLVFLSQLVLLLMVFSPELSFRLMIACATWVFVARTVTPRLSSLETLGIRAAAAYYFLWLHSEPFEGALLAIFALWIFNLFVPSILGMLWLRALNWQLPNFR